MYVMMGFSRVAVPLCRRSRPSDADGVWWLLRLSLRAYEGDESRVALPSLRASIIAMTCKMEYVLYVLCKM